METERFEALIDAILAIIITIIVMEIPLPESTNIYSLLKLYPDFIAYALSFIICFNVWNYHHNLFNMVHKMDSIVSWSSAVTIMILGLLPHVTLMVANNFNVFFAQAMFGMIFILTYLNLTIDDYLLSRIDKANIALKVNFNENIKYTAISLLIYAIGYIIGYFYYPPAIIIACIITLTLSMLFKRFN